MRVVLQAAKCSQMTHPASGTGSGGDRCTEACGAMVDGTYKVSSWARRGYSPEYVMYKFTESLNNGRDVSVPENFNWFSRWIDNNTHHQIKLSDKTAPLHFQDIVDCINRGHIAVGGFDDYTNLRLKNGGRPWPWNDPHGLGHVLLIVGYDTVGTSVIVHDPLRANPSGQPADYSWNSFVAARFHDLIEVHGPPLPAFGTVAAGPLPSTIPGTSIPTPAPAQQTSQSLANIYLFFEALLVSVIQLVASYFTKGRLT